MARMTQAQAKHRQSRADGADLKPLGTPPKDAPARVQYWWSRTKRDWPQLSQRDRQAFLDYCHLLVEQEELRELVEEHGRFWEVSETKGAKDARYEVVRIEQTPYYAALIVAERRLVTLRRDFAAPAGYRERAAAVRKPAPKGDDIDSL